MTDRKPITPETEREAGLFACALRVRRCCEKLGLAEPPAIETIRAAFEDAAWPAMPMALAYQFRAELRAR